MEKKFPAHLSGRTYSDEADAFEKLQSSSVVYIRATTEREWKKEVDEAEECSLPKEAVTVCNAAGEIIAICGNVAMAVAAAKQYDLEPYIVH